MVSWFQNIFDCLERTRVFYRLYCNNSKIILHFPYCNER